MGEKIRTSNFRAVHLVRIPSAAAASQRARDTGMSSRAGHCLRQTARYPALRCARRHAGRRVELPPPPRATPVNRRLSGAAAAVEPAAEPSPPPAVVWEGPKLEQIPRGSFFSFLREYGQWERAAEQPALSCSTTGRTLTFRDLERRVASAAAALAREGFGRGEHGARGSFLFFSRALSSAMPRRQSHFNRRHLRIID